MISLWPYGFHHSPLLATPTRAVEPAFLAMPGLPCAPPPQRQAIVVAIISSPISHERAARDLGHKPRDLEQTVRDTCRWLAENGFLEGVTVR